MRFHRIIVFGNSGSGKTSLARQLATAMHTTTTFAASPSLLVQQNNHPHHLDLDTVAWINSSVSDTNSNKGKNEQAPRRNPHAKLAIDRFLQQHPRKWIIEGCYADLLAHVSPQADLAVFMNLPVVDCQANAKRRPWEPHKYDSPEAQDANLPMLLDWIADYEINDCRDDTLFSRQAHQRLFDTFQHSKVEVTENIVDFLEFRQRWLN